MTTTTIIDTSRRQERVARKVSLATAVMMALILPTFVQFFEHEARAADGCSAVLAASFGVLTSPISRIEEDWELNIADPDLANAAPQVSTVMTPFDGIGDLYTVFVLNHRLNPSYAAGGMEVQMWYQGTQLGWAKIDDGLLQHSDEKVSWTQRLELHDSEYEGIRLRFKVLNGHSDTWGDFGGQDSLRVSIPTNLADLSSYRSSTSAKYSGVTFASHRVRSLILKGVRGYGQAGELVFEETQPVVVFASK